VDVILLAILRAARGLLADRRINRDLDQARYASLKMIQGLFRTQIVVDEATDFSRLQLACMAALCDPAIESFLACGDFNQRITEWGSRSEADLKWVLPDIDVRSIDASLVREPARCFKWPLNLLEMTRPEVSPSTRPHSRAGDTGASCMSQAQFAEAKKLAREWKPTTPSPR
jgi:DNA helicase IV